MNITLSIDEKTAQRAREAAQKMGKSLNQAVRDYLEQLAGNERAAQECEEYLARCLGGGGGQLNGWKFNREEANARR
jgi:Family of unknown function (DUF6364)